MRNILDRLYLVSGYLAAFFLFAIGATIVLQIIGRFFGVAIDSTELSGFCLAASSFLGLAYALKGGTHVRVNLLIRSFRGKAKKAIELWCCGAGAVAVGYFAVNSILFAYESFEFGDKSPGLIAAPFWIPQSGMAIGATILTIALIDEFVRIAKGQVPSYEENIDAVLGDEPPPEEQRAP
jgi:TRAP-type C4-dicarboxylate transport system permease small subunit